MKDRTDHFAYLYDAILPRKKEFVNTKQTKKSKLTDTTNKMAILY